MLALTETPLHATGYHAKRLWFFIKVQSMEMDMDKQHSAYVSGFLLSCWNVNFPKLNKEDRGAMFTLNFDIIAFLFSQSGSSCPEKVSYSLNLYKIILINDRPLAFGRDDMVWVTC